MVQGHKRFGTSQAFVKGQESGSLTDWKGRGLVRKDMDSVCLLDNSFIRIGKLSVLTNS